jgi:hypothetical protein
MKPNQSESEESRDESALQKAMERYGSGDLPPGRAAETVGMNKWDFLALAKARGIYILLTPSRCLKKILQTAVVMLSAHPR